MAKVATVFTLALCSPSGLENDRTAVRRAVAEVNRYLAVEAKQVEVKAWDTDVRPTVGSDAQDVVNQEIIDTADIGIVLIGESVGSPTPRAPSGTIEEARSFIRRKKAGEPVDLMLYFKRSPMRYERVEIERALAIVELRDEMQAEGVFWKEYGTEEELSESIRTFLPSTVRSLNLGAIKPAQVEIADIATKALTLSAIQEIEDGILDQEIAFSDAMAILNEATQAIGTGASQIVEKMKRVTEGFTDASNGPRDPHKLRRIANELGTILNEYADIVRTETDKFEGSADIAVNATIAMVGFVGSEDFKAGTSELLALEDSIQIARDGVTQLASGAAESGLVVENLPRMTKELNAAKRKVAAESARLERAATGFSDRLDEVSEAVRGRIAALTPPKPLPGLGG